MKVTSVETTSLNWSVGEAAAVNDFLNTPVGRKWLAVLAARRPKLDLANTERAALSGALGAGYDRVLYEIQATRLTIPTDNASARGIDPVRD